MVKKKAVNEKMRSDKRFIIVLIVVGLLLAVSFYGGGAKSASLTSVSITLSNPRLSFHGSLAAGNTVGSSLVSIDTSSGKPSLSTNQLQTGDSVAIGEADSLGVYTVSTTNPDADFTLTSTLGAGDADSADDVISTQSAVLTVRFTTATALNNGRFRILVPANTTSATSADGIPDTGKYDFTSGTPTVTCPGDVGSTYLFAPGTATASAITAGGNTYHAFECAYYGTGGVGTDFDGVTEDYITIDSLINPAPESGHVGGTADTHNIVVQHIDDSFTVVDTTSVAVGVIEAVKVTVSVPASISFTIAGVNASTATCGFVGGTDVTTTALGVPFGEVALDSFTDAAQTLTVTTNAVGGYAVTTIANDQLGLNGGECEMDNTGTSCIRDAIGDDSLMSHTAFDNWDNVATKGFAYSIDNGDANTVPFEYNTAVGNCTGGGGAGDFCARQFADQEAYDDAETPDTTQVPQMIFSSNTVADAENIDVCYRVLPSVTNAAGDYQNYITYTATATF